MPTFDTTPGGSAATSYASLAEFNDYATVRLPVVTWFGTASDPQKQNALMAACRILNACFDWTGMAVDPASDDPTKHQALSWPRNSMVNRNGIPIPIAGADSIPLDLKNAQCEFALQLGAGDRLSDNDPINKGITSIKAGSVSLGFSDVLGKQLTPEAADVQVRKKQSDLNYVANVVPDAVRQLLPASWFIQDLVSLPLIFDAFGGPDHRGGGRF